MKTFILPTSTMCSYYMSGAKLVTEHAELRQSPRMWCTDHAV